jgi:hypothetical protein
VLGGVDGRSAAATTSHALRVVVDDCELVVVVTFSSLHFLWIYWFL